MIGWTRWHHFNAPLTALTLLSVVVSTSFVVFVQELGTLVHVILNTGLVYHATSWFQNRLRLGINTLGVHDAFRLMIYLMLRHKFDILRSKFRANLVLFLLDSHTGVDGDLIRHYLLHLFGEFRWLFFSKKPSFLYLCDLFIINILSKRVHGTAPPGIQANCIQAHNSRYLLQDPILNAPTISLATRAFSPQRILSPCRPRASGTPVVIIIADIFFLGGGGGTVNLITFLDFSDLRNSLLLRKLVVIESSRYRGRCREFKCL